MAGLAMMYLRGDVCVGTRTIESVAAAIIVSGLLAALWWRVM
jgi:hypothetical protein